ncbi:MAG: hypothetical protein D3908_05220, partial [Candidatus Electrothrix sp. AUS4]|nr:hypothetical protein [Candidatus Electrothrix sp. AUS4]
RIADAYRAPDFAIYVAGGPVVTDFLKKAMMKDMRKFMLLVGLTIGVLLFLMFRRVSAVVLPLLIVLISLLSTLGLMAACGTSMKLPTQILPSFLLAVGWGILSTSWRSSFTGFAGIRAIRLRPCNMPLVIPGLPCS